MSAVPGIEIIGTIWINAIRMTVIPLDAIPDMFKTTANVTAHLTSAVVLARVDGDGAGAGAMVSTAAF